MGFVGERTAKWQYDNGHGICIAGIAAARDSDRGVVGIVPTEILHAVTFLQSSAWASPRTWRDAPEE